MARFLVVDDDGGTLAAVAALIRGRGHDVVTAASGEGALEVLQTERPDAMVTDVWLPGVNGIDVLRQARTLHHDLPVIVMTGASAMGMAIQAAQVGAFEFIPKPLDPEHLLRIVDRAIASARPDRSAQATLAELPLADDELLIGRSASMQEVYRAIGRVAGTDATVQIRGESGTGKERVARAIHGHSPRNPYPLLVVNCIAIPETLIESEMFGHERGAFTGAVARRIGMFERADRGTLLLDEIGDLPLGVQGKILRALQEKSFERVGGNETVHTDVRILAATHCDLEGAVRDGRFREDLYHRLNVVTIQVPALRERKEDIPLLVATFLARCAEELRVPCPAVTSDAMEVLCDQSWPGNVRQLEHCLRRTLIFGRGLPIRAEDVRRALEDPRRSDAPAPSAGMEERLIELVREHLSMREDAGCEIDLLDSVERQLVLEAMRRAEGNQTRAAALLGIPRPTLHARLHKHGVRIRSLVERDTSDSPPTPPVTD